MRGTINNIDGWAMQLLIDKYTLRNTRFISFTLCPHVVCLHQMRHSVRSFLEKELTPYANDIDRQNDFPQMRVSRERQR